MKTINFAFLVTATLLLLGCAHFPTTTRSIVLEEQAAKVDVLELAIDVAKEMDFPPVTKLDKASGIVEFGAFGTSTTGVTAQVMIRPANKVDVTVRRGSVYVPLPVEGIADEFKTKLEERIKRAQTGK
jgi:hypothetical protein